MGPPPNVTCPWVTQVGWQPQNSVWSPTPRGHASSSAAAAASRFPEPLCTRTRDCRRAWSLMTTTRRSQSSVSHTNHRRSDSSRTTACCARRGLKTSPWPETNIRDGNATTITSMALLPMHSQFLMRMPTGLNVKEASCFPTKNNDSRLQPNGTTLDRFSRVSFRCGRT